MGRTPLLLLVAVLLAVVAALLALRSGSALPVELPDATAVVDATRGEVELRADDASPAGTRDAVVPVAAGRSPTDAMTAFVEHQARRLAPVTARVVRDEDGAPIAGAVVELIPRDLWGDEPRAPLRTPATGVVRFDAVREGAWQLRANAEDNQEASELVVVDAASAERVVELRLKRRRELLVRLVDAQGADLHPADYGLDPDAVSGVTVALGERCGSAGATFVAGNVPAFRTRWIVSKTAPFTWKLEVRGSEPACVHALVGDKVLAAQPLDAWSAQIALRVDRDTWLAAFAPVAVRVVRAEDGIAVAGARVEFACTGAKPVVQSTDADGRTRLEGLLCGELSVRVVASGYADARRTLQRPAVDEVLVRLQTACSLAGIVLDQDGAPMPRARVGLYLAKETSDGTLAGSVGAQMADAHGRFEFSGLVHARYAVALVRLQDFGAPPVPGPAPNDVLYVDCSAGDVAGVVLRGARPAIDTSGPAWDPAPFPRK